MKKLILILSLLIKSIPCISAEVVQVPSQEVPSVFKKSGGNFFSSYAAAFKYRLQNMFSSPSSAPNFAYIGTPIAAYNADEQILTLKFLNGDAQNNTVVEAKSWYNVSSYQFSPQKKYLLIVGKQMDSIATRTLGLVPGRHTAPEIITLIETSTLTKMTSFSGAVSGLYITHQFSADETSLALGTRYADWNSTLGLDSRKVKNVLGENLRYTLFDMESKSILKTSDNINALRYNTINQMFVKYNDGKIGELKISRNVPLSFLQRIMNIVKKQPTTLVIEEPAKALPAPIAEYNMVENSLAVTANDGKSHAFRKVVSYSYSPQEKFLLVNKVSSEGAIQTIADKGKIIEGTKQGTTQMILLDLNQGTQFDVAKNVVTYEFSPDEKKLLVLAPSVESIMPTDLPIYQAFSSNTHTIVSLEKNHYENPQAMYIDQNNDLVIESQGKIIVTPLAAKSNQSETPTQAVLGRGWESVTSAVKKSWQEGKGSATDRPRDGNALPSNQSETPTQAVLGRGLESVTSAVKKSWQEGKQYATEAFNALMLKNPKNQEKKLPEITKEEELGKSLESKQKAKEESTLGQQRVEEKQQEHPAERAELPTLSKEEIAELTKQYETRLKKGPASLQKKSLEEYLEIARKEKAELLRLREENREKELPQIQESLVEQPAQESQRLPETQQQPAKKTTISDLMNIFMKFYTDLVLPQDLQKGGRMRNQVESNIEAIVDCLANASENERSDFFEWYDKFAKDEKKIFCEFFFAILEERFGVRKQNYNVYSLDGQYRAYWVNNRREIGFFVAQPGGGWSYSGEIVPNKPKEFSNIIDLGFIETGKSLYNTYLFFVDKNYDMGIMNVRTEVDKLERAKQARLLKQKEEVQPEVVPNGELPKVEEPLVEQRVQEPQMLPEAQQQPEEEEALPRKTLPRIEEPSIEERGQTLPMPEVQQQPEPQKQPKRVPTIQDIINTFPKIQEPSIIQNLMNRFSTVYQELPDGLGSLEDIDKAKAINAQLEQIVTQMAKELTIGNGNEWPDFFESYNKFNMMEKRKFAKIFFASPEGSFGADKQTYSVQSKDYQYRADRVSNERGIELSVLAKSGDDWLPAGKIVPNEPKEFANIIGFRFITGDPRYSLLFIDKNYDIGVINVAWEVAKLEKPKQKKLVMLF